MYTFHFYVLYGGEIMKAMDGIESDSLNGFALNIINSGVSLSDIFCYHCKEVSQNYIKVSTELSTDEMDYLKRILILQ